MWVKNTNTRKKAENKSEESCYIIVNLLEKNPAMRISEKARIELGIVKGDYVDVYCDEDRIMIRKNNIDKEFPVRIYQSKEKKYGFNLYSMPLKERCKHMGWISNRDYICEVGMVNGEKTLVCLKYEMLTTFEKAVLDSQKPYRNKRTFNA